MSLGLRIAVVVGLVIASLVGIGTLLRSGEERNLVTEATLRDRRLLGRVIAETLGHSAEARAETLAAIVHAERGEASVRLVPRSAADAEIAALSATHRRALRAGEAVAVSESGLLITYVSAPDGALVVLEEPHALDRALARVTLTSALTSAVLIALTAWLLSVLLLERFVRRPLARLAEQARRIGEGDLSVRLPISGDDDVARLVRETNAMVDRLAAARDALAHAQAERVTMLESMRHADRLRTVGELAASLAHELGTPLNTVAGHARLIERSGGADESAHKSARVIGEQATRMTKLIRRLLDFSRRQSAERAPHDLVVLADAAVEMLAPIAAKAGVKLEVAAAERPVIVMADDAQVMQVLTNLVMNALQASDGGQVVSIEVDARSASAPAGVPPAPQGFSELRVRDRGEGIPADVAAHVFDPFFTSKPPGEGTGLGLPVARGIVTEHGGSLELRSDGRGTCVVVWLPRAAEDEP